MFHCTKINLANLNPYLMCVLCGGYFIDATTIIECLHSFCKTCIVRYLESSKFCPICDVQVHKTKPLLNIRSDKTLQDLVYKLVPGLFAEEMRRRREFLARHPEAVKPSMDLEQRGLAQIVPAHTLPEDRISLILQLASTNLTTVYGSPVHSPNSSKQPAERRYLLCPSGVSVGLLKKFLKMKFSLSTIQQIDVFYRQRDEPISDDFTLLDITCVYSYSRMQPLRLFYSVYESVSQKRQTSGQLLTMAEKSKTPRGNNAHKKAPRQHNSNKRSKKVAPGRHLHHKVERSRLSLKAGSSGAPRRGRRPSLLMPARPPSLARKRKMSTGSSSGASSSSGSSACKKPRLSFSKKGKRPQDNAEKAVLVHRHLQPWAKENRKKADQKGTTAGPLSKTTHHATVKKPTKKKHPLLDTMRKGGKGEKKEVKMQSHCSTVARVEESQNEVKAAPDIDSKTSTFRRKTKAFFVNGKIGPRRSSTVGNHDGAASSVSSMEADNKSADLKVANMLPNSSSAEKDDKWDLRAVNGQDDKKVDEDWVKRPESETVSMEYSKKVLNMPEAAFSIQDPAMFYSRKGKVAPSVAPQSCRENGTKNWVMEKHKRDGEICSSEGGMMIKICGAKSGLVMASGTVGGRVLVARDKVWQLQQKELGSPASPERPRSAPVNGSPEGSRSVSPASGLGRGGRSNSPLFLASVGTSTRISSSDGTAPLSLHSGKSSRSSSPIVPSVVAGRGSRGNSPKLPNGRDCARFNLAKGIETGKEDREKNLVFLEGGYVQVERCSGIKNSGLTSSVAKGSSTVLPLAVQDKLSVDVGMGMSSSGSETSSFSSDVTSPGAEDRLHSTGEELVGDFAVDGLREGHSQLCDVNALVTQPLEAMRHLCVDKAEAVQGDLDPDGGKVNRDAPSFCRALPVQQIKGAVKRK